MSHMEYNEKVRDDAFERLDMRRKSIEDTEDVLVNMQL